MPNKDFIKNESDFTYDRYLIQREYRPENDIPSDDLLPHDTLITQGISESDEDNSNDSLALENMPEVPDADEIQPGSPVDEIAPDPDAMPGIDLLNGFDGDENS